MEWVHLIGVKNSKGVVLTEAMLQAYEATSKRELECIFCGTNYPTDTNYCSRCKEYKGLQPYIEGWSEGNE
jgi:ribosomal protein L40E